VLVLLTATPFVILTTIGDTYNSIRLVSATGYLQCCVTVASVPLCFLLDATIHYYILHLNLFMVTCCMCMRCVRQGYADFMVAGGAEACIDPLTVAGSAGCALSRSSDPLTASSPFDEERRGMAS
jgi:hypothetical protein